MCVIYNFNYCVIYRLTAHNKQTNLIIKSSWICFAVTLWPARLASAAIATALLGRALRKVAPSPFTA